MIQTYKKTLTVHMMLCNEERWCWYAIMSVIDFADQMIIFDTGSSDRTVEIVNSIINSNKYRDKIIFEERGKVDRGAFIELRNEMVQRTKTDYFMVVDGDEVYYFGQMEIIRKMLDSNENYEIGVVGFVNCAGDVKHFRDPLNEHFRFLNREGAITHRITSRHIPGIKCGSPDGKWDGFYDIGGTYVVPDSKYKTFWVDGFYLHMTNMLRSSNRKLDGEVGWPSKRVKKLIKRSTWDGEFSKDFIYPEVFYIERPKNVIEPWRRDPGIERKIMQFIKNILLIFRGKKVIHEQNIKVCYRDVK